MSKNEIIAKFCETYGEGLYHVESTKPSTTFFGKLFKRLVTRKYGWLSVTWDDNKSSYKIMWTSNKDYHYKLHNNRCCFINVVDGKIGLVGYHVLSFWEAKGEERDHYIWFIEDRCRIYTESNKE